MDATIRRLIAVNLDPSALASLQRLGAERSVAVITAGSEADLLANAVDGGAVIALGLSNPGVSPVLALRALALTRTRPAIVLIGEVEGRVFESLRRVASDLRLDSIAHVRSPDEAWQLVGSLFGSAPTLAEPSEADLRRALDEQSLSLHYQPKFSCQDTRQVVGVEALVRWPHADLGLLRPGRFLPLAERAGLLMDLTDFTIVEAIRQHAAWREQGLDLPVSINLAPGLIRDEGFADRLLNSFRQYGVAASRFTLEVKETGGTLDRALCAGALLRLRRGGVGLSLDDYGTGLSSLTELYELPFSELKLDRALVADAPHKGEARIVMRGIVRLAHELGIGVCAEGVETRAELNGVLAAGCDAVQGTLLCEPESATDVARSLADRRTRYLPTHAIARATTTRLAV